MSWFSFPSQCVNCHQWPSHRLCDACRRLDPRLTRCPCCGLDHRPDRSCPGPLSGSLPWDQVHASLTYSGAVANMLRRVKFQGEFDLLPALADWMCERPPDWLNSAQSWVWIPMPSSPARLQARGFNVSKELVRLIQRRLRTAGPISHALRRAHAAMPQSRLGQQARWLNTLHAFELQPKGAGLTSTPCVLVDDVMTTGATLMAAAQCLKQSGFKPIHIWVLARTPTPHTASS